MRQIDQLVTKAVLEAIDTLQDVPWRKTWKEGPRRPTNLLTGRHYSGINSVLLGCSPFSCSYWVTFNQCKKLGGCVRKGQKGTMILFPMVVNVAEERGGESKDTEERTRVFFRPATVFNIAQCEGLEMPGFDAGIQAEVVDSCESVLERYVGRPEVIFNGGPAYDVLQDKVLMPHRGYFERTQDFYAVLFHEMAHSSGHSSRLNRFKVEETSEDALIRYGFEELVAEIAACMLGSEARIDPLVVDNQVAYLKGWRETISADPTLMLRAASAAQKAFNFMCPEEKGREAIDQAA